MITKTDKDCIEFIKSKIGHIADNKVIDEYLSTSHKNYIDEGNSFFMCIAFEDEYAFIYFAWSENTYKARKRLWQIVKRLRLIYKKDILFTTDNENIFKNHSKHIVENLYSLMV